MRTRHLLDPALAAAIERLPNAVLDHAHLAQHRAQRAQMAEAILRALPEVPGVESREHRAPQAGGEPDVRLLLHRPAAAAGPLPALLWIHGGGFVGGSADWEGFHCRRLAAELGCVVVAVDYRLAPETPYPGAVEDCYAALAWLHGQAAALGLDPARIGIAGASAGGGLAAALALLARDRREWPVCFQALLQPMLDDRTALADDLPLAGEYVWTREHNHFGWSALLDGAPGGSEVPAYAAPARAASLAGLPPTFISIGALDLFLEESLEFARRLVRAGVPTELHVHPGACHAFPVLAPECAAAQAERRDLLAALRRALVPA